MQGDLYQNTFRKSLYFIVTILLFLSIAIWFWWVAPEIKKIPKNFSYQADILSLDNLFDEKEHQFIGEEISKTNFSYKIILSNSNLYVIKNLFDVHKQSNELIFSTERTYYINPYTSQHLTSSDQANKPIYLFGPRYADKNGFYYIHVNYNVPVLLKFVNKEIIDDLTVYHYHASFSADQSNDLKNVASSDREIITDVNLNIWIEPISGWLIKYQDNSIAWFYDKKTHTRLNPWNKFSNRYTESSIEDQIKIGRQHKYKILLIDFGMPIFLVILALIAISTYYIKVNKLFFKLQNRFILSKIDNYIFIPFIFIILTINIMVISYFLLFNRYTTKKSLIGIAQWDSGQEYTNTIQGFKDILSKDKNIIYIENNAHGNIENQIYIIQSFIKHNVDLILTQTTNGTLIAKGITNRIPIVYSLCSYPVQAGIVHSLQNSKNNLTGARNYILPATQFRDFATIYPNIQTLAFVHHKGEPNSIFQFNEYKNMLALHNINIVDIDAIDGEDLLKKLNNKRKQFDAIYLACDTLMHKAGGEITIKFSNEYKIPTLSCDKLNVTKGALMGYISDYYINGKLAGDQALWILHGAEPSWLETLSPKHNYLIINMKTAALLGILIPPSLIHNADYLVK